MLQYRANKCFQKSAEAVSGDTRISQIVRQWVPGRQASNRESPSAVRSQPVSRKDQESSRRLADLRCCREATSETGRQSSTKYCGDWPCRQLFTMMQSLYMTRSGTLSQCSSVCSNRESLVEACQSSLLAHPPEERYSNRRVTTRINGRVSLLTSCRVNAGNAAAAEASRSRRRWRRRRVDRG